MKIFLAFFLLNSVALADCRGCCSRSGGVVCVDGVTQCADGSALSNTCEQKSCNRCTESQEYDRESWPHWVDSDSDCQNTRAEILLRDNTGSVKYKRNRPCKVSRGEWICPYTQKKYTKASDIDIDHIVPLYHAHINGAGGWSREQKREFANDPENLLAVEDNANQEKGGKSPLKWLPQNEDYWTEYAKKWLHIKKKYGLKISKKERAKLDELVR